jgi:hypothetical protein
VPVSQLLYSNAIFAFTNSMKNVRFFDNIKKHRFIHFFNSDFVHLPAESDYNKENKRGANVLGVMETQVT